MMKFFKYAFPCAILLFAACNNTATTEADKAQNISDVQNNYTFEKVNYTANNLPKDSEYKVSGVLVKGDNAAAVAKMNQVIEQDLKLDIAMAESNIGNKTIQQLIDEDIASWREEAKTEFFNGFMKNTDYKAYTTKDLVVVETNTYSMTGGAHGNSYAGFLNLDAKTGNLIDDYAIFKDTNAVKDIILPIFITDAGKFFDTAINAKDLNEAGFQFEDNKFALAHQITIKDSKVLFYYNPYEIGPYVMGDFMLEVDKELLKDQLRYQ